MPAMILGKYETVPPPNAPAVDVVIPFWCGDSHLVSRAVRSALASNYVTPTVHVIADGGAEFPEDLPDSARRYKGPQVNAGPYALTNALVAGGHCQTPYLALLDADDEMVPDRLWRQIATMQKHGYEMTSGGCQNVGEVNGDSRIGKAIYPGRVFPLVPWGHTVNSTRTMTLDFFCAINGFANMPCSGDWQFDNRALGMSWSRVFGGLEIDITRWLHPESLTNGQEYGFGTPKRQENLRLIAEARNAMQKSPTLEVAASLGGLSDKRVTLSVV